MIRPQNVSFIGESGECYPFLAMPMDTQFGDVAAVYVITHRQQARRSASRPDDHETIYVSHTADLSMTFSVYSSKDPYTAFGANCICILPIVNPALRAFVEQDLLAALREQHCN